MNMTNQAIDAQRLSLILNDLRLPAIKLIWPDFAERADKEGWPGARLIAALAEHEIAERDRRDSSRAVAPLVPASDALILDSTAMPIDDVVDQVLSAVRERLG